MDHIEYYKLDYWEWECPECKIMNGTWEDPNWFKTVSCNNCGKSFIPVDGD